MTRRVITVKPETPVLEAARTMLQHHISGLPVIDDNGKLEGMVTEADLLRRSEIGTQRPRIRWLDWIMDQERPQPNTYTSTDARSARS
jgi:CBS domain-containing protein